MRMAIRIRNVQVEDCPLGIPERAETATSVRRLQRVLQCGRQEFSIGSLEAGSYYIQVNPRPSSSTSAIHKGPQETYLTTYYPGVTDPSKAIAVQVPAGSAVRGIEIRTGKTRAYRVRGRLVASAGGVPPPSSSVQLGCPRRRPANGKLNFERAGRRFRFPRASCRASISWKFALLRPGRRGRRSAWEMRMLRM